MADDRERNRPTQQGPRDQAHLDAQSELHNDPSNAAPYQMGSLDAAADGDLATGEQTGTARRAERASGQQGDPETAADAERALLEARGNREERSQGSQARD